MNIIKSAPTPTPTTTSSMTPTPTPPPQVGATICPPMNLGLSAKASVPKEPTTTPHALSCCVFGPQPMADDVPTRETLTHALALAHAATPGEPPLFSSSSLQSIQRYLKETNAAAGASAASQDYASPTQ